MQRMKVGFISTSDPSFIGDRNERVQRSLKGLNKLSEELGFDLYAVQYAVFTEEEACKAVRECEDERVDFLLVQHTTCSGGSLAPIFAGIKNARLGLWAIPEEASEGLSPFNSFVGLTFFSGILGHYVREKDIPFKWFYGNAEDELFKTRFGVTIRALTALKNLCNSKIALVGGVSYGFGDLFFDERSVKKTFPGIYINQYHEYGEIKERALGYKNDDVEKTVKEFVRGSSGINAFCKDYLDINTRLYMAYRDFMKENRYDAAALNCIYKVQDDFKTNLCAVIGKLNDDGIAVACEGDMMGAISMLLLKYLTGSEASLMDFPQFDEKDNSILMWHCGSTTGCFACNNEFALETSYSGMPIVRDLAFKPDHVTIARIAGEADKFLLADGSVIQGKKSFRGVMMEKGNSLHPRQNRFRF